MLGSGGAVAIVVLPLSLALRGKLAWRWTRRQSWARGWDRRGRAMGDRVVGVGKVRATRNVGCCHPWWTVAQAVSRGRSAEPQCR